MQIAIVPSLFLLLFSPFSFAIQGYEPVPAPYSGEDVWTGSVVPSPYATVPSLPLAKSPEPGVYEHEDIYEGADRTPAPAPTKEEYPREVEEPSESPISPSPSSEEIILGTVKWCAVRDEYVDCQYYISLLRPTNGYIWICVRRETVQECLDSIKEGEADLVNLDAGLAYIAFMKYSMKAIANEVYCNHAESFDAVAVVNRMVCENKGSTSLLDFKGKRSCHGGYSTATGWNYPVTHLKQLFDSEELNDKEMVTEFFSGVCAPSEFKGTGLCSGCGNENGSCHMSSFYSGHEGAFRCLVEDLGDVAFVRAETALLYSMEGPHNQTWSTKSFNDFMYLCPQGGCREINGYPGDCSFGTVPANVIMTSNYISNEKRLAVLDTLINGSWNDVLYTGKNGAGHMLSTSTQGLAAIKKVTRSYLGTSASISQSIQELNTEDAQVIPYTGNSISGM
uniref:Transferrin-like domain-containing protein n=1 Tax=Nelumbo nucifera TaxID=4432 RepID=A0A822Y987_NELNU|nr:TPA_asm: hypothetical protein HUJ06_027626 [Nelumbo nucifera]